MPNKGSRNAPGQVRDTILAILQESEGPLSVSAIHQAVMNRMGNVPKSSVRSYLLLNTPTKFHRTGRGFYVLRNSSRKQAEYIFPETQSQVVAEEAVAYNYDQEDAPREPYRYGRSELYLDDCFLWLARQDDCSIHAVVTDPPYGVREYTADELSKLRSGRGGVWRIPPSFDGSRRTPVPRFTVLNRDGLSELRDFFLRWGKSVFSKLVPGANVIMASNPLLSAIVSEALAEAGLERRGELVRLTMTMRGGDRPKNAEQEFSDVSVMPRSMWEPWLLFRRPLEGRVQDNLRKWGTGGFRRIGPDKPFGDVIKSAPTHKAERTLANHPSLKPQAFMRQIVRAALPLGRGIIVDTFAGSGSTLAAAEAVGYASKGVERDETYWKLACKSIPELSRMVVKSQTDQDTATYPLVF